MSLLRLRVMHRLGLMTPLLRFECWASGRDGRSATQADGSYGSSVRLDARRALS